MEISALVKERGTIKASLTRFKTFINSITPESDGINEISIRLQKAETLFDKFSSIQTNIENLVDDERLPFEETGRVRFEDEFYKVISEASRKLKEIARDSVVPSSGDRELNLPRNSYSPTVKLPVIDLPSFDGSHEQYLYFRDTFETLINKNESLAPVQKFHYLRAALKGKARDIIQNLELSDANYEEAWKLVKARYDNKRLLTTNHIKGLFEIQALQKESYNDLRHLLDNFQKHLRTLKVLNKPVDKWDCLIVYLISSKLDSSTRRQWEEETREIEDPSIEKLITFLNNKCQIFEAIHMGSNKQTNFNTNKNKALVSVNANYTPSCSICKGPHYIQYCEQFLGLSPELRSKEIQNLWLCLNCLRPGHWGKDCKFSNCRKCGKRHNTLLHFSSSKVIPNKKAQGADTSTSAPQSSQSPDNSQHKRPVEALESADKPSTSCVSHNSRNNNPQMYSFLSTAIVKVTDKDGFIQTCRVLLDNGSESNFITESLCNKLGCQKSNVNFNVSGINGSYSQITHCAQIKIMSRVNSYKRALSCLVIPKITEKIPSVLVQTEIKIPNHLKLADPTFNVPGDIDLLVGVSTFYELQSVGQIFLENSIRLQKTLLGWIVSGPIFTSDNISCNLAINKKCEYESELSKINKFWELEEVDCSSIKYSQDELFCENNFVQTTSRAENGQFVVTLPLNKQIYNLGDSKTTAMNRLLCLERRFQNDAILKKAYCDFMREYLNLGHMSESVRHEIEECEYYLPHHAVLKPDSATTKLRVVFDASAKSTSGVSLNNCQYVGPNIQDELFSILLRFRKYIFVLMADVTKMYRMVLVNKIHRPLQRIVWRFNCGEEIKTYDLKTVTYGTAAASFLATRALLQTAIEHESDYPLASNVIKRDFYVDDLITGFDSVAELIMLGKNISKILRSGGFELRKWASNSSDILREFSSCDDNVMINLSNNLGETKTLGICFNTHSDKMYYSVNLPNQTTISKRAVLSNIASIFDPLGLLSPITIKAKLLMQSLWKIGLSWDESLPANLHFEWLHFREKLSRLNDIKISRRVICENATRIECHIFADSSEKAYASSVYIRSQTSSGEWQINLLCAKTKVAPLKKTTLPRLELCAAVLSTKLVKKVQRSVEIKFDCIYFWTDSLITLSWIRGDPSRWQTFVGNRVAEIQNASKINQWHHITSKNNPADCATRGINADELMKCDLWWHVPWLSRDKSNWPVQVTEQIPCDEIPESKVNSSISMSVTTEDIFDLFDRYSCFQKLLRVTAYILRFHFSTRKKSKFEAVNLTVDELNRAQTYLVRAIQQKHFLTEIRCLSRGNAISKQSKILSLAPFLDEENVLRVGGRLSNSNFLFEKKHPILLPKQHPFTYLVFRQFHIKNLHCGPQTLLFLVREQFWPISGKCLARKVVHDCVTCFRANPKPMSYLMGQLPKARVEPLPPFTNTGIDFGGPFALKNKVGRGSKFVKCYICLFVCMSTRAIHLELVLDLTTDGFLSALKRFFARRGKSSNLYSDNGKNFVGASKELAKILKSVSDSKFLSNDGISWYFIPPYAPNFGGIWEAGIKSTKHHLKRVIGNIALTYDEFITILAQIEAVVNSRPLSPLSDNPNDMNPITPGHFLIGKPLTSTPDHDLIEVPVNRLSKYQRMQQIVQGFWRRWSVEYISQLQSRTKWKTESSTLLKVGALVVVRDENLPPLKWDIGRIKEVHPGSDGVIRVVTVQCSDDVKKRPVSKICVLPVESNT